MNNDNTTMTTCALWYGRLGLIRTVQLYSKHVLDGIGEDIR